MSSESYKKGMATRVKVMGEKHVAKRQHSDDPFTRQQQEFVKGDLSVYLGSDRLVAKKNRIGVSLGINQIGSVYYARVEPQLDLRFFDRKLAIGFGVPLDFFALRARGGCTHEAAQ